VKSFLPTEGRQIVWSKARKDKASKKAGINGLAKNPA
jgi:hypothetical protein